MHENIIFRINSRKFEPSFLFIFLIFLLSEDLSLYMNLALFSFSERCQYFFKYFIHEWLCCHFHIPCFFLKKNDLLRLFLEHLDIQE